MATYRLIVMAFVAAIYFEPSAVVAVPEVGCDGEATSIQVRVHSIRSDRGYVKFVLYGDNPDHFLAKGKRLLKKRVLARKGMVQFCIIVPSPGVYAAAVYHDENGNNDFDKNWIGLPIEGFGVSNNPQMFLTAPSHAEAAFEVRNGQTTLEIEVKY